MAADGESISLPIQQEQDAETPEQQPKEKRKAKMEPRPYQTELVEHALRENTIVNLGTGAGKTFVAVMLIKEMSGDIQGDFTEENGKRTVFLAHTVPLVKQQAGYIRDNSPLKVQDFCGDSKGIDNWPRDKWYELFDSNHVLVMSRQIFLDLLNRGIIYPRQLNLIVFDECHHATKNDPYVQIMKVIKDAPIEERPRVLGLSASLLGTKVKPGKLKKGVVGLEEILMSHARTAKDLQDVVKNATAPTEKILNYSIGDDEVTTTLRKIIDEPLQLFQTKLANKKIKLRLGDTAKNLYEDLMSILQDLGPASAAGFVTIAIKELRRSMVAFQKDVEKFDYGLAVVALTHLTIFDMQCQKFLEQYGKLNDSNKVKILLWLLGDNLIQTASSDSSDEGSPHGQKVSRKQVDDLRGIIFVERRHTASCLCKLLNRKRKEQSDLKRIRCDFVVGHNVGQNATSVRKEARMKSNKQELVLSKFRNGKINILIATSVIEEGVDVPKCNLVVRFDLPQNFRSFVQSKGRARNKPSLYYLLVGNHQLNKIAEIGNYHRLEQELIELCQEDRVVPTEEEIQKKMRDKIPPYMPNGRDGARATIGNSLAILHRYCYKLPHDDFTKLAPIFEVVKLPKDKTSTKASAILFGGTEDEDEDPNHNYICTITLPINCPIQEPIKGPEMGSKLQAHRAAARIAIEKLHRAGELDNLFFPIPSIDSDDEDTKKEKENPSSGTERRHWLYRNEVSEFIRGCYPMPNEEVFLYAFMMRDLAKESLYCSTTSTNTKGEMVTTFGLMTRKRIPHRKIPKFSLFIKGVEEGETEVQVSLLPLSDQQTFLQEELHALSTYHKRIFSDILEIVPEYMEWNIAESDKNYLIVPLKLNNQLTNGSIDFELIASMDTPTESTPETPSWPRSLVEYDNALVTTSHRDSVDLPIGVELFTVMVDHDITPLSPFPTPQFKSFQEYFQKKRNYEVKDLHQPGLKAYRFGISSLKYISSNYYGSGGGVSSLPRPKPDKKVHTVLFPEIVDIYHIRANVFKLIRCLPSILWRLESLLLMEDLTAEFNRDSFMKDAIFTDTPLRYGDTPPCTNITPSQQNGMDTINSDVVFHRRPDNSLLLQSLTPKAANDAVNLERLELLGDSLLKIVSTVYLYNQRINEHEGKLSSARSRRISNLKLYVKAKLKKTILGKILSNDLLMGSEGVGSPRERLRFVPPGYVIPSSQHGLPHEINPDALDVQLPSSEILKYLYHRFNDKMVADCMEALIGAFTISGGIEGGIRFMEWLKLDMTMPNKHETHLVFDPNITPSGESNMVPLIIAESSYIFRKHFGVVKTESIVNKETFNRFMSLAGRLQRIIGYTFTNHHLLFGALTHLSYTRHTPFGCYSRLEFLGDAVLDYLITAHLYHSDNSMTPGTISSIRSALLCNHRLAEMAVDIELNKFMIHSSPDLFKKVPIYCSALKKRKESVEIPKDSDEEDSDLDSESDEDIVDGGTEGSDDDDENDQALDPPKPLSDTFEALCGAVFIDTKMSLSETWKVFKKFLEPKMKEYRQGSQEIPVNLVKQLYDRVPTGIQMKRKITRQGFRCVIKISDKNINASGVSRSFKNAKILAASQALKQLNNL